MNALGILFTLIKKGWHRALFAWWAVAGGTLLRIAGVQWGARVRLLGMPIVSRAEGSAIRIGSRTVLTSDSRFTALGVSRPVVIRTMTATARIEIGENVGISGASICAAVGIAIGDECLFGAGVEVSDTDFHPLKPEGRRSSSDYARIRSAPVVIEKNVFLGSGVRVLKGVRIGRDAVIGAGAVVTSDVPAGGIAVGNPARVIGSVYSVSP